MGGCTPSVAISGCNWNLALMRLPIIITPKGIQGKEWERCAGSPAPGSECLERTRNDAKL